MLGAERQSAYAKRLARGSPASRRRALRELEDIACRGGVAPREKTILALVIVANFHLRPLTERRDTARFLDVFLVNETSARLARRLEVTRLEEVDPETRDSLHVAAIAALPDRDLVDAIEHPSREDLTVGLGLLIALEAAYARLRLGSFHHRHLPALIRALRAARAHRASHVAKPFLWRLECVLETAMRVGFYLTL